MLPVYIVQSGSEDREPDMLPRNHRITVGADEIILIVTV